MARKRSRKDSRMMRVSVPTHKEVSAIRERREKARARGQIKARSDLTSYDDAVQYLLRVERQYQARCKRAKARRRAARARAAEADVRPRHDVRAPRPR